jgi:hypothetical protein
LIHADEAVSGFPQLGRPDGERKSEKLKSTLEAGEVLVPTKNPAVEDPHRLEQAIAIQEPAVEC